MNLEPPTPPASVLVACLCADWCDVCRDYQGRFLQMQAVFPHAQFVWIDVEDEAELVDPLEVENFPTLLIAVGHEPRFFGPLTPQPETLERLIRAQTQEAGASVVAERVVADLVARIRAQRTDPGTASLVFKP